MSVAFQERARYPINVRYFRDFCSEVDAVNKVLVSSGNGQLNVPLSELARVEIAPGTSMLRDENGLLTGYVYIDFDGPDAAAFVRSAQEMLDRQLKLPTGSSVAWSGQCETINCLETG